jgi:hypothetical protein
MAVPYFLDARVVAIGGDGVRMLRFYGVQS